MDRENYRILKIKAIEEFGVYCDILDQPGYQGFIPKGEVASSWVKDINKVLKVNQIRVGKVLDIDDNVKTITLSLKRVQEKEEREIITMYNNEITAVNIIKNALSKTRIKKDITDIVNIIKEKYNNVYDFLRDAALNPDIFDSVDIPKTLKLALKEEVSRRFSHIVYRLRLNIEARHYGNDGLIKIKQLFENLDVRYLGGGKYTILLESKHPKELNRRAEQLAKELEEKAKTLGIDYNYHILE